MIAESVPREELDDRSHSCWKPLEIRKGLVRPQHIRVMRVDLPSTGTIHLGVPEELRRVTGMMVLCVKRSVEHADEPSLKTANPEVLILMAEVTKVQSNSAAIVTPY